MERLGKYFHQNLYLSVAIFVGILLFGCNSNSTRKLINSNWSQIETEHFRIVTNDEPKEVKNLAEDLERFRIFTQNYLKFKPDHQKLTIYALADRNSFARMSSVKDSRRTVGLFRNTIYGSFALLNLNGNRYLPGDPARQILFHEYIHFLIYSGSQNNYPYWFSEGVAEVFSTVSFGKDNSVNFGKIPESREISLTRFDEMPLELLLTADRRSLGDWGTETLYASGWMLTHWLLFDVNRNKALGQYLQAYNDGADSVAALLKALGMTFEELDSHYRELTQQEFNYFEGELSEGDFNIDLSIQQLGRQDAITEVAHFMAVTGQGVKPLTQFLTYAESKEVASPAMDAVLAIAQGREENYSRARQILDSIPTKYHEETWFIEASTEIAFLQALTPEEGPTPKQLKDIRDGYVELVNRNDQVPSYWYKLAITMQVMGYPRRMYQEMLEQAYLRAPREIDIAWWYAQELYLSRDQELFPLVARPLLMQVTNVESRNHLKSMMKEIQELDEVVTEFHPPGNGLSGLLSEYRNLSGNKALAMAVDYKGAYATGIIEESASQAQANDEALKICEESRVQYQVRDRCELYAEGNRIIDAVQSNGEH